MSVQGGIVEYASPAQNLTFHAAGTITGSVRNAGTFGSDSTLSITSNLTLLNTSQLLASLGGTASGSFMRVTAPNIFLEGTLAEFKDHKGMWRQSTRELPEGSYAVEVKVTAGQGETIA